MQIRRFLETKKDFKTEKPKIIASFTFPILDYLINSFAASSDYTEFNELLISLINLAYLDEKFIDYFLKDNIVCEKLFNILYIIMQNELYFSICDNILLLLGNFFSRPHKMENVLKIIPFQDSLTLLVKSIKTLPNYIICNLLWVFRNALKNLPGIFNNYIHPELLETTVKKAEFYIEQDLCYQAFMLLDIVTKLKDEKINDFLISKLNLLNIILNYIKKNYDFEITAYCVCILLNMTQTDEKREMISNFFKIEAFWVALDAILIDISANLDKYDSEHLKIFLYALLKIFRKFLLAIDEKALIVKTTENAIEINLLFLVSKIETDILAENYLMYIKKKIKSKKEVVFASLISISFLQFLFVEIFEGFKDDLEIMELALYILESFFDFEKNFEHKLITNAFVQFNAYAIVDNLRQSFNDVIAEKANSIFEYFEFK